MEPNGNISLSLTVQRKRLIDSGIDPNKIESAVDLAADPERRLKFQHGLQKYVDHAISSTLNLPAWGSDLNNEDKIKSLC